MIITAKDIMPFFRKSERTCRAKISLVKSALNKNYITLQEFCNYYEIDVSEIQAKIK